MGRERGGGRKGGCVQRGEGWGREGDGRGKGGEAGGKVGRRKRESYVPKGGEVGGREGGGGEKGRGLRREGGRREGRKDSRSVRVSNLKKNDVQTRGKETARKTDRASDR